MDSITLNMPITIKAKLTEKLRKRLNDEMDKNLQQLDLEVKQINIQEKRVIQENVSPNMVPQQQQAITAQIQAEFGEERQKRLDSIEQLNKQKEDLEKLVPGAEIVQGELSHMVEVKVGDNIREKMNIEILVEDDKIIAIRS